MPYTKENIKLQKKERLPRQGASYQN